MRKINLRNGDIIYVLNIEPKEFEPIFKLKAGYKLLGTFEEIDEKYFDKYLDFMFWDEKYKENYDQKRYYNYHKRVVVSYPFTSAKESFISLAKNQNVKIRGNDLLIIQNA